MSTFYTYRFHANNPRENLANALQSYWDRLQVAPKSVAINPKHLTAVQDFLKEIELGAEVKPIGGCLVNEIWLEV